ncbi:unnamed protein product [Boreogadus saida]
MATGKQSSSLVVCLVSIQMIFLILLASRPGSEALTFPQQYTRIITWAEPDRCLLCWSVGGLFCDGFALR